MHKTITENETELVAYYRFDHISGTALDDRTPNENDGTLHNMDDSDWVTSTASVPFVTIGDGNWESNSIWNTGQNAPVHPWSRARIEHIITINSTFVVIELKLTDTGEMTITTGNTVTVSE